MSLVYNNANHYICSERKIDRDWVEISEKEKVLILERMHRSKKNDEQVIMMNMRTCVHRCTTIVRDLNIHEYISHSFCYSSTMTAL